MDGLRVPLLLLCLASLSSAGCCCVPATSGCYDDVPVTWGCESGGCDVGCGDACCMDCGLSALGNIERLKSCRNGCGEIYVDEWVNERPVPDNCGYDCGGCGRCGHCRPLLKTLKLLWGTPYRAACCGIANGCGCDSCAGGVSYGETPYYEGHYDAGHSGSSCNCGAGHHATGYDSYSQPAPQIAPNGASPNSHQPAVPMEEITPQPVPEPTPAPTINPTSARRLSPAQQKLRRATYRVR